LLLPSPISLTLWRVAGSLALLWSSGVGAWSLLAGAVAAVGYSSDLGAHRSGVSIRALLAPRFQRGMWAISILGVPLFIYLLIKSFHSGIASKNW